MSAAREQARSLSAQALKLAPDDIDEQTAPGVTPQWDSLAHMNLILALEEQLGRQMDAEAIVSIAGLADVIAVLETDG